MKILFICKGNMARSQMAEAIFNNLTKGKHTAISAGTKVTTEEKDREGHKVSAEIIIAVMKEIGIDISTQIRNQLTPEILAEADKAIVMAQLWSIPEYLTQSTKTIYWEVPDPAQQSMEFAREVRNQLQTMVSNLVKELA